MQDYTNLTSIFSFGFILLGALIYYFGLFIGSTRVEEYDKTGYYIYGFFFFITYLLIPFGIVLFVNEVLSQYPNYLLDIRLIIYEKSTFFILLHIIILSSISLNVKANHFLNKFGLLGKAKTEFNQHFEKVEEQFKEMGIDVSAFFVKLWKKEPSEMFEFVFYDIPIKIGNVKILFVFSNMSIYLSYHYFKHDFALMIVFVSCLFTFLTLTFIAMSVGYNGAHYPIAKIQTNDGTIFNGKILKFGKYVYLLDGNKKIFINANNINYVEQCLLKEKSKDGSN